MSGAHYFSGGAGFKFPAPPQNYNMNDYGTNTKHISEQEFNDQLDEFCDMIIDDFLVKNGLNTNVGSITFGTQNFGTLTTQGLGNKIE